MSKTNGKLRIENLVDDAQEYLYGCIGKLEEVVKLMEEYRIANPNKVNSYLLCHLKSLDLNQLKEEIMAKPRVLVIDDDVAVSMSAKMYLEGIYEVTTETDPSIAIELVEKDKFDAILLDLSIPGWDGVEILKKLKEKSPEIPVFMVSGWTGVDEKIQTALQIGAVGYIAKPFSREKVTEAVDKVLKKD